MKEELDADHYDRVFAESAPYALGPDDAPWAPLWRWLVARVRPRENVVDFGCGPGHLAELLHRRGHPPDRYLGVDFSAEALRQARRRAPGYRFVRRDVVVAARELGSETGAAVLCEVLEHIEGDLELLSALPSDTRVLATVPSYDSAGHVRHFETFSAVCARYEQIVQISAVVRIGRCFGFSGVRA